jgi:hypothetical protein|nr:MAG TPA: hypothetical protein [Caudoviricetes sp.]
MMVQYEDLTREQKEILYMITEDCKKSIEKLITEPKIKTVDTYIIEIKLEDLIL